MFRLAPSSVRPRWNAARRELTVDGVVVKRFRTLAESQIAILDAFEELGWPPSILDPLPGPAAKRGTRLHNAVTGLNECQCGEIRIRFERDGTGRGVCWGILEPETVPQENSGKSAE